ncbi:uncharacterized protein LOC117738594 isoform X3 [Cyclopterus lumpus]|nr:uncharacterized protein LOC117738594 isoform X3 [Cyclopterus lumpus]
MVPLWKQKSGRGDHPVIWPESVRCPGPPLGPQHQTCVPQKAHQRLFFLRTLKKNHLSSAILVNFYRCVIESILTNCVTVWYGSCSVTERKRLQRVKIAQHITGTPLPSIEEVQKKRRLRRARSILKDSSHPAHRLFSLRPSGRRFRSLWSRTSRLRNSFFPRAVTFLNSTPL